jgi:hypothetical protein
MRKLMSLVLILLICAGVKAGTLAYWQFDDNEPGSTTTLGERIIDSSGYDRDLYAGTDTDTPTFKASNPLYGVGSAIAVDSGTDELIFYPNHDFGDGGANAGDVLDFAVTDSFTIEAMVRIPVTTSSATFCAITHHVSLATGVTLGSYLRFEGANKIRFSIVDATNITSSCIVSGLPNCYDGNWHHIAAVRDADNLTLKLYLDYVEIGTDGDDGSTGFEDPCSVWYIGAMKGSSTREFNGSIDFIRISDAALLPAGFVQPGALIASNPTPADKAYDVAIPSVALSWTPASGTGVTVSSQVVQVAVDANFDNVFQTFNLNGTATTATLTPVVTGRGYYWRVNTTGTDNGTAYTEQGAPWYFQTVDAVPSIAGYWKFDNFAAGTAISAGDKILDSSGNGRHLCAVSVSTSAVAGYGNPCAAYGSGASFENNKGMMLNLVPGYVYADSSIAGSHPVLPSTNGDITIEAVIKAAAGTATGSTIYTFLPAPETDTWYGTDSTDAFYFRVNDSTGYLRFTFNNDGVVKTVTGTTSVYDAWHHVAAVRNTTTGKLAVYIDGVLNADTNDTTPTTSEIFPTGTACVGGFSSFLSTARNFKGNVDFVKVTRSALDPSQFVQSFAIPTNPNPVDGAVGVPINYTFSWTPITGATITSQTVKVSDDAYMQNIVKSVTASGNSATVTGLDNSKTYYWRVDTVGSDGGGSFSRQGEIWSFGTPSCLLVATDGDLNGDCVVDFKDFAIMAGNWLASEFE